MLKEPIHSDELARANQLYLAVCRIMLLINSSLDTDEIMRRVVVEAANAIGCDTARIALRDKDHWVMTYLHKLPEEMAGGEFTDEELPHAALAMVTRKPVAIDDAMNDKRTNTEVMRSYGIKSVLVLPLMQKEEVIGALLLNYHLSAVTFSEVEIEYAEKIAAGAAVALQNARLFQDLKAARDELEEKTRFSDALNEIDRTIYSTYDTDTIFNKVLRQAAVAIGAESSMVFIRTGDDWMVRHVYKLSKSLLGRILSSEEVKHTAITAETKIPLAVTEAYHDDRVNHDFASELQIRSLLDFPLIVKGQVIGDLAFHYHSRTAVFRESHVDFIAKLQNSLSLALENARLFEALSLSESRLKEAESAGNFGYFHLDRKSGKLAVSDGFMRIIGRNQLTRELDFEELWKGCQVQPEIQTVKELVLREEPANFEVLLTRPDNSTQVLHVLVHSLLDSRGRALARLGTVQDVSEQKRTLQELERTNRVNETTLVKLEAIVGSMNDGLVIADMAGNILHFNPAAVRLYGFKSLEETPRHVSEYSNYFEVLDLDGTPLPFDRWPLSRAISGESFTGYHIRLRRRDSETDFIGNYSGGPVRDRAGNTINAMITVRDVTALKRAEEELHKAHAGLEKRVAERTQALLDTIEDLNRETEERLRAAEEIREKDRLLLQQTRLAVLGEMIGNIAHQWRQPLNNIGLIAQELPIYHQMGQLDKEYLEGAVGKIMDLVRHMSQTISDFRNFFKPDKAKVPFDLHHVAESSLALAAASFKEENVQVVTSLESGVVIEGYPSEFSQVLLNLYTNARDAFKDRMIEDRRLEVKLWREDKRAILTISDNAGGIPEEIVDRIFDPYFTTKQEEKGTGIGLYMSKMIIETNMHGSLTVKNIVGGAEFRIELCCVQDQAG